MYADDAIYCSQCGQKLLPHKISSEQTLGIWPEEQQNDAILEEYIKNVERIEHTIATSTKKQKHMSTFIFRSVVVMILILVLIITSLTIVYRKELNTNELVLALQSEAKVNALQGEYNIALQNLDEAIALRPNFQALTVDQDLIYAALRLERLAEDIDDLLARGVEVESERKLDQFRQELNGYKEPLFDRHRERLEELNMKFTVLSLTNELTSIGTVEELGNLLNVVNGLVGEEAASLRDQIEERIRTTTNAEVNELVKRKRYSQAISSINESLTWLKEDEGLIELKTKTQDEQAAYEKAEQERIERAMEEKAAEDYINQTAAIEMLSFEKMMNEIGQSVVVVYLKNTATRAIYDITVKYTLQNQKGQTISQGASNVTPEYVLPGEGMSFTLILNEEDIPFDFIHNVTIEEGTWSLD